MKLQIIAFIQRLYFPLTFSRVLMTLFGIIILGQGIYDRQWLGILVGVYFLMSGLFSLGCVGGNCAVPAKNPITKD